MTPHATPLPQGLPHIACILLWYPLFTQPFIFREVESLRKLLPLAVYSLYGLNTKHCSTEMRAVAGQTHTFGMRATGLLCGELARNLVCHPLRTWRLLRRCFAYRWTSWETLGENVWAFCVGLYLGRLFRDNGTDMIYAPWPRGTATAAWVAAHIAGIPFVMAARGDNLDPADPDLGEKLRAACAVRANNAADMQRIVTFDQGQAQGKVTLIYNSLTLPMPPLPTHPPTVPPGPMPRPLRLLALGRFDVTKGFDVLVRACGLLRDRGLDFTLTLAGGGGAEFGLGRMEGEILRLRAELRLEERIHLPGLVSHNELPALLQGHHIFVAPCVVHASGRRDGIPNTVIEALAYGVPIVSTTVNALPEVVRHEQTGLTVPPGDPEALAEAIQRLADDAPLAARLAWGGQMLTREMFNPQRNAQRLVEMFLASYARWREIAA